MCSFADASPIVEALQGQTVVLDLASPFVYVGRLAGVRGSFLVLEDADAHDLRDAQSTREKYVREIRQHGVHPNRGRVWVGLREIVGISRLEDVITD